MAWQGSFIDTLIILINVSCWIGYIVAGDIPRWIYWNLCNPCFDHDIARHRHHPDHIGLHLNGCVNHNRWTQVYYHSNRRYFWALVWTVHLHYGLLLICAKSVNTRCRFRQVWKVLLVTVKVLEIYDSSGNQYWTSYLRHARSC